MSSPSSKKKMIALRSADNETFEVEEAVAMQAQTIRHVIEVGCADSAIPLSNVRSDILAKVIEYCKKHAESEAHPAPTHDDLNTLKTWDAEFLNVDSSTLYHLLMAANYLNIGSLLNLIFQTVADMLKGKSPEEIRRTFNIKNDFTPEEEEAILRENRWSFE